jgi:phosphatidylinositol glycan class T
VFPRTIARIVDLTQVQQFTAQLTRGRWKKMWGVPMLPDGTQLQAPVGALLEAEFSQRELADAQWRLLVHALGGLMCASFNTLENGYAMPAAGSGRLVSGSMGREAVCTENLTPWVKLLPCGAKAGLAQLLDPRTLFSTSYHSMYVLFRPRAPVMCCCLQVSIGFSG